MITIQNLSKKFGKLTVLKNINLELKRGECIALIGPNGCGKTTQAGLFYEWLRNKYKKDKK